MRDNYKQYPIASKVICQRSGLGWTAKLIDFIGDVVFQVSERTRAEAIRKASEYKKTVHKRAEAEAAKRIREKPATFTPEYRMECRQKTINCRHHIQTETVKRKAASQLVHGLFNADNQKWTTAIVALGEQERERRKSLQTQHLIRLSEKHALNTFLGKLYAIRCMNQELK